MLKEKFQYCFNYKKIVSVIFQTTFQELTGVCGFGSQSSLEGMRIESKHRQ